MKRTQHEVAAGPRYHAHTVLPADTHAWCENCGAPDGPTWAGLSPAQVRAVVEALCRESEDATGAELAPTDHDRDTREERV